MHKTKLLVGLWCTLACACGISYGQTYTTIDDPLTVDNTGGGTGIGGISGNTIVGTYSWGGYDTSAPFMYDGANFATVTLPNDTNQAGANGISGSTIVGTVWNGGGDEGFIDDISNQSYTLLVDPLEGASNTEALGVNGDNVVGIYFTAQNFTGFLYNITSQTFATLTDPLAGTTGIDGTYPTGIYGNTIVGHYINATGSHGFVYNMATQIYTTLDDPLTVHGTGFLEGSSINGIYGNTYVGDFGTGTNEFGFIYNGGAFTTLQDPSSTEITFASGIDGNTVVGTWSDNDITTHGFELVVPEPSCVSMLAAGCFALLAGRRCRGRENGHLCI